MTCCSSSLILKQSYQFATDFNGVLLHLANILSTWFKSWVSYRQLTFITETFEPLVKAAQSLILLYVNIQCATACLLEQEALLLQRDCARHLSNPATTKHLTWKTRVPDLLCGIICVILCLSILIQYRNVTHTQTDGQTHDDGIYHT